jgi:MFS family permease
VASLVSGCAIGTSLLVAVIGHRLPKRSAYLVGFLIGGAPRFVVLALGAPLWLVLGVNAIAGLGLGLVNPIISAIQFERIPTPLLGRVRTLNHALSWSGIPFGGLVGGTLIAMAGLPAALSILGLGYLIATAAPAWQKEWSAMARANADTPTPPAKPSKSEEPEPSS